MKTLFTAHATTVGGREGTAETDNKSLSVKLSPPGVNKPGTTNPEELFACGYGACFGGALAHVARMQKLETGTIEVKSEVSLNQDDNGFFISVKLNVTVPSLDQQAAEALVQKAHEVCPYSKATRGNVEVKLTANGKALSAAA